MAERYPAKGAKQLGRIARNRSQTGIIAENEQDNADLWRKIRNADEHIAHLVSARIVQFAAEQGAGVLVFEHLGTLKSDLGKYSRRGNSKRAFWMKGRIFTYANTRRGTRGSSPVGSTRATHRENAIAVMPASCVTPRGNPRAAIPLAHRSASAQSATCRATQIAMPLLWSASGS